MEEKEIRKVFNYESTIMEDKTLLEEGYYSSKWGETSNKFIWAICRYCGEPHRIRKGFYNKAGSACHKECRIKEQRESTSPFSKKEVREKSAQTNLIRYGNKSASSSRIIKDKISKTKLTKSSKDKTIKTNQERFGVDNVFQNEDIKGKIKETNILRYGHSHAMQNEEIKNKTKNTCFKKYGVDNVLQNEDIKGKIKETNILRYGHSHHMMNDVIKEKARKSFDNTISLNNNGNYNQINILRNDKFWDMIILGFSLKNICKYFDLNYQSVTSKLLNEEFREKYGDSSEMSSPAMTQSADVQWWSSHQDAAEYAASLQD